MGDLLLIFKGAISFIVLFALALSLHIYFPKLFFIILIGDFLCILFFVFGTILFEGIT